MKKNCSMCGQLNVEGIQKPRECNSNYVRLSGLMEATLARKLVKDLLLKYEGRIFIEKIISDDDSTMRLHCTNVVNGGKL